MKLYTTAPLCMLPYSIQTHVWMCITCSLPLWLGHMFSSENYAHVPDYKTFFIFSLTKGCPYFPEQTEPEWNTHSKYGMNTLALIISANTEPQTYTHQCLLSIQLCAVSSRHLFSLYHVGNSTKLLRGEQMHFLRLTIL